MSILCMWKIPKVIFVKILTFGIFVSLYELLNSLSSFSDLFPF